MVGLVKFDEYLYGYIVYLKILFVKTHYYELESISGRKR